MDEGYLRLKQFIGTYIIKSIFYTFDLIPFMMFLDLVIFILS